LPPGTPARGLPLPAAAAYSGIAVRRLWALITAKALPVSRIPGQRAVIILRDDLDALLERHRSVWEATRKGSGKVS
jgi:hypothetical protein